MPQFDTKLSSTVAVVGPTSVLKTGPYSFRQGHYLGNRYSLNSANGLFTDRASEGINMLSTLRSDCAYIDINIPEVRAVRTTPVFTLVNHSNCSGTGDAVQCPICMDHFPQSMIEVHASDCIIE